MKTRITITLEEQTANLLRTAAAEQNRSLSNLVETVLREWVNRENDWPPYVRPDK